MSAVAADQSSKHRALSWNSVPEAAGLGLILLLQTLLFAHGFGAAALYDEGVYLASLDALRAGQQLGTDVFAAQPPGFYYGLRAAAALFGNTVDGVRVGVLVLGLLGSLGAYVALRVTVGVFAGQCAAAFLVIAPPVPLYATRVLADIPALDVALLSVAAAALAGTERKRAQSWAVAAGVVLMVACSVKLIAIVAAPTVFMLIRRGRASNLVRAGAGAGAVTAFAVVLVLNIRALPELRVSLIDYHRQLRDFSWLAGHDDASPRELLLDPRAAFTWLLVVAVILATLHSVRDRRLRASPFVVLALCTVALVTLHRPLFEHHVVAASVGLSMAAAEPIGRELGRATGAWRAILASGIALMLVGGYVQQTRRAQTELPRDDARLMADIALLEQRTRPGDIVVSDQPILAYRARRHIPGSVADSSSARFVTGLLTDREVLGAVDSACAQAVIAGRTFSTRPALLRALRRRFGVVVQRPPTTFYFRRAAPCPEE